MPPSAVCADLLGAIGVVLGEGFGDGSLGEKSVLVVRKWVYIFNRRKSKMLAPVN